jgi:predicted dehydrogenase
VTIRIGCLGAARIAPIALIEPSTRILECDVVAIASRSLDRARTFAARYGVAKVASTYDDILDDPMLDAVYIALPNSEHAKCVRRAISAKKHVLCEKPFTVSSREASEIVGMDPGARNLVVMEAFHWKYHPLAADLEKLVTNRSIGDLENIDIGFSFPLLRRKDYRWDPDLGGGALLDVGCYCTSMARHLLGKERITVKKARMTRTASGVDRCIRATLEASGGCSITMTASMLSASRMGQWLTIRGSEGEAKARSPFTAHRGGRLSVSTRGGSTVIDYPRSPTTFDYQLRAFTDAVLGRRTVVTGAGDALENMILIDEIRSAAMDVPRRS